MSATGTMWQSTHESCLLVSGLAVRLALEVIAADAREEVGLRALVGAPVHARDRVPRRRDVVRDVDARPVTPHARVAGTEVARVRPRHGGRARALLDEHGARVVVWRSGAGRSRASTGCPSCADRWRRSRRGRSCSTPRRPSRCPRSSRSTARPSLDRGTAGLAAREVVTTPPSRREDVAADASAAARRSRGSCRTRLPAWSTRSRASRTRRWPGTRCSGRSSGTGTTTPLNPWHGDRHRRRDGDAGLSDCRRGSLRAGRPHRPLRRGIAGRPRLPRLSLRSDGAFATATRRANGIHATKAERRCTMTSSLLHATCPSRSAHGITSA